MVVRNEAARLEKCLVSLQAYVSQIVIVDTGSEDESIDIAKKYTRDIIFQPFSNFAIARNTALSRAREEWILVMDPDEEIDSDCLSDLVRLTENTTHSGYRFPRYDYLGCFGWGVSRPCRLFQRKSNPIYLQPVFEEPFFQKHALAPVETYWGIGIHHFGYQFSETELMRKRNFYFSLLAKYECDLDPVWLYESRALLSADAGDINRALQLITSIDKDRIMYHPEATLLHARLLMNVGSFEESEILVKTLLSRNDINSYQRCQAVNVHGLILAKLGRLEEAEAAFRRALSFGFTVSTYSINLGIMLYQLGLKKEAQDQIDWSCQRSHRITQRWKGINDSSVSYQERWLHRLDTVDIDSIASVWDGLSDRLKT